MSSNTGFNTASGASDAVSRSRLQRRTHILELLFSDHPLPELLSELIQIIEQECLGMVASILLLSDDKGHLLQGAAPSLPDDYNQAVNGIPIGQGQGSCGTAAYTGKRVIVTDIETHPYWNDFKQLALGAGLKACWSEPVFDSQRQLLGTFAMYYYQRRVPTAQDIELIEEAGKLASILIERFRTMEQQRVAMSIFDSMPYALMILNHDMNIIDVNPAFSEITGYSEAEALGISPAQLLAVDDSVWAPSSPIWDSIEQSNFWQGEIQHRHKCGDLYDELLTVTVIRDDGGEVVRHIAISSDISARKAVERLVSYQANHDRLTGLPNRNLGYDRLKQMLAQAQRKQLKVGLMVLDLDHFKNVNDSLGHDKGDELLVKVSEGLRSLLRNTDTLIRLGGDEFVLLIPELDAPNYLEEIAKRVLQQSAKPYQLADGELVHITCSVGISVFPDDGSDMKKLFSAADQAMYQAKSRGRYCFQFFTESMQQEADRHGWISNELKAAIEADLLKVYYQPVFNAQDGRFNKFEALLRWPHPEQGCISPAEFIPVAEKCGLIRELGIYVREKVCQQSQKWLDAGHELSVSVNVSTLEFLNPDFATVFVETLNRYHLPHQTMVMEITESALMKGAHDVRDILFRLRDQGVRISIDDFGTGYSSLAYLAELPIDELKIDRRFIDGSESDLRKQALIDAMLNIGRSLGLEVVAEGVETEQQSQFLQLKGCHLLQGFLFHKPQDAESITALLGANSQ